MDVSHFPVWFNQLLSTVQGRRKRKEIQGFPLLLLLPLGLPSSKTNTQPLQGTLPCARHYGHPATCFSYEVGTIRPTLWMRTLPCVFKTCPKAQRWSMTDAGFAPSSVSLQNPWHSPLQAGSPALHPRPGAVLTISRRPLK